MEAFFSVAHMAKRAFTANPSPSFSRITVDLTRFFTACRQFFRTSSASHFNSVPYRRKSGGLFRETSGVWAESRPFFFLTWELSAALLRKASE